ncbi:hypothetical protein E3U43_001938 [Larimichthys crocea]|nr:hypothetical protein E3U43_001938 [Larimichthys crocea]
MCPPMKHHSIVLCSVSAHSGGSSSSCVHSWIEQIVIQSRHSTSFSFLNKPKLVPDKLDLSLCTVGTSSAFLQTADNICLLTCTVTCRTLLTLQIILPLEPAPSSPVCPIPVTLHPNLRSTNPVPPPQAASSQCKLKTTFHIMPFRLTR